VSGRIDPVSDIETINTELALADLQTVEKQLARYGKVAKTGGDKEAQRLVAVLEKVFPVLNEAKPARTVELSREELFVLRPLFLLTMKPTMYVANVAEHGFENNPLLDKVRACREGRRRSPTPQVRQIAEAPMRQAGVLAVRMAELA
jgi:ribosome-binding ATPase YchF (GTP1/OBG family)